MCCLVTILLLVGPRAALVAWWLMDAARFAVAFSTDAFPLSLALNTKGMPFALTWPYWVWPLLGVIFVPWTTLAYLLVFPGGLGGSAWLWLGLGLLIDLGSHIGGGYRNRDRIPGYRR